jgi:hypothetical protein
MNCLPRLSHLPHLKVTESSGTSWMYHTLEDLGSVERLLLLQEKGVADDGNATCGLAVCWVGPWDTILVREVWSIIETLASALVARDFGDDVGLVREICKLTVLTR